MFGCLFVCLFICLFVCLIVCVRVCVCFLCLFMFFFELSVCLFVLFVCLFFLILHNHGTWLWGGIIPVVSTVTMTNHLGLALTERDQHGINTPCAWPGKCVLCASIQPEHGQYICICLNNVFSMFLLFEYVAHFG